MSFTISDKVAGFNFIPVEQYGALGDGTTDDSTAIQTAIDVAVSNGGIVKFGPKNYFCAKPLHVYGPITLEGEGRSNTIKTHLNFAANICGIFFHIGNTYIINGNSSGATIRRIAIRGTGTPATSNVGLLEYARIKIEDCNFGQWYTGIRIHGGHSVQRLAVSSKTGSMIGAFTASGGATGNVEFEQGLTGIGTIWCEILTGTIGSGETITVGGDTTFVTSASAVFLTNANTWRIDDVWIDACTGYGVLVAGGDSNAGCGSRIEIQNCPVAIYDHSFLGNTWLQCVTEGNVQGFKLDGIAQSGTLFGCYSENSVKDQIGYPNFVLGWSGPSWNGLGAAPAASGIAVPGIVNGLQFASTQTLAGVLGTNDTSTAALLSWVDDIGGRAYFKFRRDGTGNGEGGGVGNYYWNAENTSAVAYSISGAQAKINALVGATDKLFGIDSALLNIPTALYLRGKRIDLTTAAIASSFRATWAQSSIRLDPDPAGSGSVGSIVTVAGTTGIYSEGITATTNGTVNVVLSSTPAFLRLGEYLTINSTRCRIEALTGTALTTDVIIPAGSGLVIAYAAPTWVGLENFNGMVNNKGSGAGDIVATIGSSLANASVNATAKLLSVGTGIGGTYVESLSVLKVGNLSTGVLTIDQHSATNAMGLVLTNAGAGVSGIGFGDYQTRFGLYGAAELQLVGTNRAIGFYTSADAYTTAATYGFLFRSDSIPAKDLVEFRHSASQTGNFATFKTNAGVTKLAIDKDGMLYSNGTDGVATIGSATVNKPSGINTIASGATTIVITNSLVPNPATTKIRLNLTMRTDPGSRYWWTQGTGTITVNLQSAAPADTSFDWEIAGLI